jgi:hypothetical protein
MPASGIETQMYCCEVRWREPRRLPSYGTQKPTAALYFEYGDLVIAKPASGGTRTRGLLRDRLAF